MGKWLGEKMSRSKGPSVLVLPLRGFSEYDREGGVFYDPAADQAFMDAAVAALEGGEASLSYASGMAAIHGALLGAGASGTVLSIWPRLRRGGPARRAG